MATLAVSEQFCIWKGSPWPRQELCPRGPVNREEARVLVKERASVVIPEIERNWVPSRVAAERGVRIG